MKAIKCKQDALDVVQYDTTDRAVRHVIDGLSKLLSKSEKKLLKARQDIVEHGYTYHPSGAKDRCMGCGKRVGTQDEVSHDKYCHVGNAEKELQIVIIL